jgi:hypothetical protein
MTKDPAAEVDAYIAGFPPEIAERLCGTEIVAGRDSPR